MKTAAGGGREEALARLRAAIAAADTRESQVSPVSHVRRVRDVADISDVPQRPDGAPAAGDASARRAQRDDLHTALVHATAVPRPLAPDVAGVVHQALRLLDRLRWSDEDPSAAR